MDEATRRKFNYKRISVIPFMHKYELYVKKTPNGRG